MQTESLGARFREQREKQQVTLAAIADQTKIKAALLEGLERDDLSHWPEGIFRRSWVRAYAKAIGLDPDTAVREFLEVYPDPVEVTPADSPDRQSIRIRQLLGTAVGALSSIRQRYDRRSEAPAENAPPGESSASLPVESSSHPVDVDGAARPEPQTLERDLSAFASLCTRLARMVDPRELRSVLAEAATIVDAIGMILWVWDPRASALSPVLAHGYSDQLLAQMPVVSADAENAIAMAFRSADACVVNGSDEQTGAVVVPLITSRPSPCVGVLALELQHGGEQREWVRALAGILAAQLATLVASPAAVEAISA
jgi:transcriptional regulator with XRE-family HTH domain